MPAQPPKAQWVLLLAVFIIATCGLIYELVAGTLASYLLGDSVMQFSTIIGIYLFSMGIGSYLSKFFNTGLLEWFIRIELLVGLIGGFSSALLFILFPLVSSFQLVLYVLVGITGILVGLEIPLLMRLLQNKVAFKELVSRVFTVDYIGALLASLIFPLVLVPRLGIIRTSLFFGICNIGIGWYLIHFFRRNIKRTSILQVTAIGLLLLELVAFVFSEKLLSFSETMIFNDNIVFAQSSSYQRIVLTRNKRELRLFLNGNLQFSSADEYRYHEALVHPALSSVPQLTKVLVLGGGDGLAVREILKYPSVESVVLVDLDPAMTKLFKQQEVLTQLNEHSLTNRKVSVINCDAFTWLRQNQQQFDAIIIDFPDPSNFSIGKLYSTTFYELVFQAMRPNAVAVVQSTSPFVAPKSFWCVNKTLQSVGFETRPYHNYVPSFGEWGYILATPGPHSYWFHHYPDNLRYLNQTTLEQMFIFPADMQCHDSLQPNKLNNQSLVHYFEVEWGRYLD